MPSPGYWREIPTRLRLEAVRCRSCENVVYPSRRICPHCHGTEWEPAVLSRKGDVITSTVVHVAPDDFAMQAPYVLALVETPEGARLMVQVTDCDPEEIKPGTAVDLEFRKIRSEGKSGILCYGFKAVPAG